MFARVKQDYAAGPVMAFSGREYIRTEWREVPAGFEDEAKNHPLLDVQPSLDEVRAESSMMPGLGPPAPEPDSQGSQEDAATAPESETQESHPQEQQAETSAGEPLADDAASKTSRKGRTKK